MKILLPEGSSMSARDIVFALGKKHQIDIVDPSWFCQLRFSSLVRKVYRCPSYSKEPQAYLEFLLDRLQKGSYDVLLPTHEQVYLLSRFQETLSKHVALAVPDFDTLNRLQSKADFTRLLEELEIPVPPTRIVRTRQEVEQHHSFPCFFKIDYSTAGNGVRRADNRNELRQIAAEFEREGLLNGTNEILLQDLAVGHQCTALAIFEHGRMLGQVTFEIRRPGAGGWGMNGESVEHPEVVDHMVKLGAHLKFHGALFVDYFYDPQHQRVAYIEANPRFGCALFPALCGLDFGELFLQLSLKKPIERLPAPKPGVRFHQGFLMLISAANSGATRRELWREFRDACARRGFYEHSEDTITRPREDRLSLIPATAVTLLLLAFPRASQWLVRRTLANYTLPASGAQAIRELPLNVISTRPVMAGTRNHHA